MSIGESCQLRGRVFFVRFDGVDVVVIEWWLSKNFLEPGAPRLDIGYVREGFPYNVGEMVRDHEVGDVGTKYVPGLDCCGPVGIVIV